MPATKLDDAATRAKIIRDLEGAVKNPTAAGAAAAAAAAGSGAATAAASSSPNLRAAAKEGKLSGAEKLARWKQDSWLFAITQHISNWLLIAGLLLLLCWGRHMLDPLQHLVGYQVVVTDITVLDGDTFKARVYPEGTEARFRLRLVDAPDLRQPYGPRAAETLLDILSGGAESRERLEREVIVSLIAKDEQAGGVGGGGSTYYVDALVRDSVFVNTTSVQLLLVERGAAWALRGFHSAKRPSQLVVAMEEAKAKKVGLWAAAAGADQEPEEPWVWARKQQQGATRGAAADSKKKTKKSKRGEQSAEDAADDVDSRKRRRGGL